MLLVHRSSGLKTGRLVLVITAAAGLAAVLAGGVSVKAADPVSGGAASVSYRRLSQDQYRQSIADIFGADIKISGRLEPDPRRDGLIAIGVANASVGAAGFEQYDAAAREVARQVTDQAHRDTLIGCAPQVANAADGACSRQFVERVGRLLFRRPLEPTESAKFVALADRVAAEKALPFEVRVPNAVTMKAMRAADRGEGKLYKSAEALMQDLGI